MQFVENNIEKKINLTINTGVFAGGVLFLHSLGADSAAALAGLAAMICRHGK
jgi:hypothetical protein